MSRIVPAILLLAVSATAAFAGGFVPNYSAWKKLPPRGQQMYAAGIFDSFSMAGMSDDELAITFGINQCAGDLSLSGDMLAEAITGYYEAHPDQWDKSPAMAFHGAVVMSICLKQVNQMRVRYKLEPWKKP